MLDVEDLTPKVRRSWDHDDERAVQAVRELAFRDIVGLARTGLRVEPTGLRLIKEQFPAAMYIKAGFDAGFLRHAYFLVEKPGWPVPEQSCFAFATVNEESLPSIACENAA